MEELKVGTKIMFDDKPTHWEDLTVGVVYTIIGIDKEGDAWFIDDVDEPNYAASFFNEELFHVVDDES
jgi:hypothetical protein